MAVDNFSQGLLGMTVPREYGGSSHTTLSSLW